MKRHFAPPCGVIQYSRVDQGWIDAEAVPGTAPAASYVSTTRGHRTTFYYCLRLRTLYTYYVSCTQELRRRLHTHVPGSTVQYGTVRCGAVGVTFLRFCCFLWLFVVVFFCFFFWLFFWLFFLPLANCLLCASAVRVLLILPRFSNFPFADRVDVYPPAPPPSLMSALL